MDFSELVKIRQSDRKYEKRPVEHDKIQQCIETARLSPSSNNSQPWKFVIVESPEKKEKINSPASGAGSINKFVQEAPIVVAVVQERQAILSKASSIFQQKDYSQIDIGIAVNQFCLQARDLGLGTCILGWFNEKKVKEVLEIPKSKRVPLLIVVGYPASPTREKKRKPTNEMSSWDSY